MDTQSARESPMKTRRVAAGTVRSPDTVEGLSKPSVSACGDVRVLIAKRAYELYVMQGCRDGRAR